MLCTEPDIKIIFRTIKNAIKYLYGKKLHVFGLKIKALKYLYRYIHSFDSMAWTRPVNNSLRKYFPDRKNRSVQSSVKHYKKMRELYFQAYLKALMPYIRC